MTNTVQIKEYNSLNDVENEVYHMISDGINYRNISQTEFMINGTSKKFSISQISKIKQKLSAENSPETQNEAEKKAELFELFYNKMTVVEVIIKTKYDTAFVYETFKEYARMSGMKLVSEIELRRVGDVLFELEEEYGDRHINYESSTGIIKSLREFASELDNTMRKFQYPCHKCRKLIKMSENAWIKTAKPAIIRSGWRHVKC